MTSLARALLLLALALPACDDGETNGGRMPAGRYGLVAFNGSGFEHFSGMYLPVEHWYEGFAGVFIAHPVDDAGRPRPDHLTVALQFGGQQDDIAPLLLWDRPLQLQVHIRQRDDVPRGTRTLFTADMQPPALQLEYRETATAPVRRYAGEGRLEVFAADLKTGAAWGRLAGELYPLDGDGGPHPVRAEFAALAGPRVVCTWDVLSERGGGIREVGEPPEGRADHCTAARDAIMAAEAHPDAPPVPDFQPAFYGLQRPPARWGGLDRDL